MTALAAVQQPFDVVNTINGVVSVSPGTGKTMLAKRLPTIMPQWEPTESTETTRLYSPDGQFLLTRSRRRSSRLLPLRQPT